MNIRRKRPSTARAAVAAVFLSGLLLVLPGVNCDAESEAVFRQEMAGPLGDGVKTILNGLIDATVSAVQNAGDGPTESNDTP